MTKLALTTCLLVLAAPFAARAQEEAPTPPTVVVSEDGEVQTSDDEAVTLAVRADSVDPEVLRRALERDLGVRVELVRDDGARVTVDMMNDGVVRLRVRRDDEELERQTTASDDPTRNAAAVSLIISNLVRDESGEILALANRPTFDPNHAIPSASQTVNLAVQTAYEPGSTLKAITVAAALEQGTIRPDQTFFCEEGRWQYTPRHAIRDTKRKGWLDVTEILAVSSNICTTKIYETLGKESLYRWIRRFHFGERPDVQLPAVTPGLVADIFRSDHDRAWTDSQPAEAVHDLEVPAGELVLLVTAVLVRTAPLHDWFWDSAGH